MARKAIRQNPSAVTYAEPSEVAAWASELNEKFLLCREMGHNWRPWAAQWVPQDHCYERVLRCTRCKTEREQVLTAQGAVVASSYHHAPGYLRPPGEGRLSGDSRDALRLESLIRAVGERSEDEE